MASIRSDLLIEFQQNCECSYAMAELWPANKQCEWDCLGNFIQKPLQEKQPSEWLYWSGVQSTSLLIQ